MLIAVLENDAALPLSVLAAALKLIHACLVAVMQTGYCREEMRYMDNTVYCLHS